MFRPVECVFILGFDGLFTYLQRSAGDAVATGESFPFITPLYLSQSEARECALPQVDAWDPKHEYFTMCLCNPLTGGGPPLSLPPCRCAPRLRFPFLPAAAPQALLSPSFLSWDLSPPFPPFLPSSSPSYHTCYLLLLFLFLFLSLNPPFLFIYAVTP